MVPLLLEAINELDARTSVASRRRQLRAARRLLPSDDPKYGGKDGYRGENATMSGVPTSRARGGGLGGTGAVGEDVSEDVGEGVDADADSRATSSDRASGSGRRSGRGSVMGESETEGEGEGCTDLQALVRGLKARVLAVERDSEALRRILHPQSTAAAAAG